MKKTVKIISLCLALVALTAFFAGCDYLDEMKANHAVMSEDKETISFRGDTYKKLPETASLYSTYTYHNNSVKVTDSDVPVLLKDSYGYYTEYREDTDIFYVVFNSYNEMYGAFLNSSADVYSSLVNNTENYYCNEKDYEKYVEAIENGVLDHIGFEYEVEDENFNYYYTLDVASKEVSNEILGHITNPAKMTEKVYEEIVNDYSTESLMNSMYKCDGEGLLTEFLDGYDIYRNDKGDAYLINFITEKAVKLTDKTADALKDVYFYGDYKYSEYYAYSEDDEYIGIIGSDDGEEEIVVGDVNLIKVG